MVNIEDLLSEVESIDIGTNDSVIKRKDVKKLLLKVIKLQNNKYKKAFYILNCYFDSISNEEQFKVTKQLEKLGL